jgi:hypothetical protein
VELGAGRHNAAYSANIGYDYHGGRIYRNRVYGDFAEKNPYPVRAKIDCWRAYSDVYLIPAAEIKPSWRYTDNLRINDRNAAANVGNVRH